MTESKVFKSEVGSCFNGSTAWAAALTALATAVACTSPVLPSSREETLGNEEEFRKEQVRTGKEHMVFSSPNLLFPI